MAEVGQESAANGDQGVVAVDLAPTVAKGVTAQDIDQSSKMGDTIEVIPTTTKMTTQPIENNVRSAPRGRGNSRARGKARGSTGRKRKRDDEDDSDASEIYAPTATMTKSGRAVQKPTSFVPPAVASPVTTPAIKKKRIWRKNPENAVCKLCLRGVTPANNMIVFCDGCNTPYHQWCHHPPIDRSVVEETDKEWLCRQCLRDRIEPIAEADIAYFVAAGSAPAVDRQKFFSSLTPGALVTLLTRATTLFPQLPVFDPDFAAKYPAMLSGPSLMPQIPTVPAPAEVPDTIYVEHDDPDEDEGYGPEEHPAHYVRPGKGLMSTLPPDKTDETLVDEETNRGVFHHLYIVDEKAANEAVNKKASK